MNFDAITMMALVDAFDAAITGGRVQDTVQIDATSYGMEVYAHRQRRYVLLSADQQYPRVLLASDKLRRGVQKPFPLALLLRRYAEGARLEHVKQPPWERVLTFRFDGPEGVVDLVIEPMARRANLLLVRDDGVIMDCVHRVGPQENRYRASLPGKPYVAPPPQKLKRDPLTLTHTLLGDMLDADPGERTRQVLTRRLLGISPQVAKELVFRATGAINTKAADTSARTLFGIMRAFFDAVAAHDWQPGVVRDGEEVQAFSVYPVSYLEGWEPVSSVSVALEEYYGPLVGEGAYAAAKKPVRAVLDEAQIRVTRKLESLRESLHEERDLERLKQNGELILAYQYMIQPGDTELRAQYEVEGPELAIAIDPSLTPVENGQRYFEKYEKAKRARAEVPKLVAQAEHELGYLNQLATDLELASNWPEIGEVQEALQKNGYWRGKQTRQPRGDRSAPLKVTTDSGYIIWVGRNARQNDIVTFDKGGPADLWLHVRGEPGAHVIIKSGAMEVPDDVIERAAEIAAYYSRARQEARVLVDVTRRKYVRKIKGGKPGMVTYRNESPVEVTPAAE